MTLQKWIKWIVFLFPLPMTAVIVINDLLIGCVNLVGWLILLGIIFVPNAVYAVITIRIQSLIILLVPAIMLCAFEIFVDYIYVVSTSSTTAIMFVFTPFYGVAIVLIGLLLGWLIQMAVGAVRNLRKNRR